jgi:hypothetical protein
MLVANGRYTPESDRLLRCRETTLWADTVKSRFSVGVMLLDGF